MKALAGVFLAGLAAACGTISGPAADKPATPAAVKSALASIAAEVSETNQHSYIERMVGFGTRSTISDQTSNTRGIGAARRWVESEFRGMSSACGGCLEIVTPSDTVTGQRYPQPTLVVDVVAIQRGTTDPNRVIIIQGHLDSRNSTNENITDDAPGANDDASGVAAVMESARILSKRKFPATLVFAALSGEEQGLSGGKILADYAKVQGWKVEAVLNNDIVGNTHGLAATIGDKVRVFSEGVRTAEPDAIAAQRRITGGELDSPMRNIARYMRSIAEEHIPGFSVMMVYRRDRFGRSGDQVPMLEAGFPAVRVTEASENYTRQHQNIRVENGIAYGDVISGVDFPYLARVTRLNVLTMASLASAPPPPLEVIVQGAVSADTNLSWSTVPGAASYIVWWRDTLEPVWTHHQVVSGVETKTTLTNVVIDNWFFGVSAVSAEGYASPIQSAGIVGAFFPPPPRPAN